MSSGEGTIGFSVGKKSDLTEQQNSQTSNSGSMVGSLNGNTNIIAGKNYQQTGSSVASQQGDVNILAQQVNIEAAKEQSNNQYKHELEQKGLNVAVNIGIVDAVKSTINSADQIGKSKNSRVNAMAIANTGFKAYQATQAGSDINLSVGYGQQKSSEFSQTQTHSASKSQVYAGGTTSIVATGAGDQSDINIIGSDVLGMQGTQLAADHDINLKAAKQTSTEQSSNKSDGWNAGITYNPAKGIGVTAGVNTGRGKGNGTDTSYLNSHVGSKDSQTIIQSGNDTNIISGQVLGKGVLAQADTLNIQSLQDSSTYNSKQHNASVQLSNDSVSGTFGKSKIKADYQSVNEQSGIFAGDDGFQIKVNKNTDLKGGLITSTQAAEDLKKNSLNTGTLTYSDIQNNSEYDAKGISVSAGFNAGKSDSKGEKQPATVLSTPSKTDQHASNSIGVSKSIGFGLDSDKNSSVTKSGIMSTLLRKGISQYVMNKLSRL